MSKAATTTRTGSAMSSKQMAYSVRHGRKVNFHFVSGIVRDGYICGEDSFHWRAITSSGLVFLVHKSAVEMVEFPEQSTYDDEPYREELEKTVGPFREFVEVHHFGKREGDITDE